MNKTFSNKKAILIFILPSFILFTTIVVVPVVMSFYYSLFDWDGIREPVFNGFNNYIELFRKKDLGFVAAIVNAVKIAFASLFIQIPLGLILALILSAGVKGEKFFRTIYFIPFILSAVVIGQLWKKVYHVRYGVLNQLLEFMGLEQYTRLWLADQETALTAVVVPIIFQFLGYYMLLLYAGIKSIPDSIIESAQIDGATGLKMSLFIKIPLLTPILKICATFAVVGSMKVFDIIYVMTNGGPLNATQVPSTLLIEVLFMRGRYGLGSTIGFFIFIECMILTIFIQWLFRKSQAYVGN
jgi:raffinose/stachyose/melibiose transport system permease protein